MPSQLELNGDAVHVWHVRLEQPATMMRSLYGVLSSEERSRASRFRFERHAAQFVVARGMLRQLLSCYTGLAPEDIGFKYNEFGKPILAKSLASSSLHFNLSHSGDLVLYGFTNGRHIGVDIEHIDSRLPVTDIASRFFSEHEQLALSRWRADERARGFFECWTQKEAYLKALGCGLSLPTDAFDVSLVPGEQPRLLANRVLPDEPSRWAMAAIAIDPAYAATVVWEGPRDLELTSRQLGTDRIVARAHGADIGASGSFLRRRALPIALESVTSASMG